MDYWLLAPWLVTGMALVILGIIVVSLIEKLGRLNLTVNVHPEAKSEPEPRRSEPKADAEPRRPGRPAKDQPLLNGE